jgi:hypothetical protein
MHGRKKILAQRRKGNTETSLETIQKLKTFDRSADYADSDLR